MSKILEQKNGGAVNRDILLRSTLLSVAGLLIAILGNIMVPQIAEKVIITEYPLGPFVFTMNSFYRLVLAVIILVYLLGAARARMDLEYRKKFIHKSKFRFAIGIALLAYDILGTKLQLTTQPFFPGPAQILESFLIEGNVIGGHLLYSLRLFSVGFSLGTILGIVLGILIGWFPKVHYWLYPVLRISGVIPAVAWMPFALTLFPTPFGAAVFLMVITACFPIASQTSFGIESVSKSHLEAAYTLGAKTPFLIFRIALPSALPQMFTGITSACASSFTILVIAEMMGQPGGLGYYINVVKVWSAYYKVFAAILLMAILFSLILAVLNLIRSYALRWQRGMVK